MFAVQPVADSYSIRKCVKTPPRLMDRANRLQVSLKLGGVVCNHANARMDSEETLS